MFAPRSSEIEQLLRGIRLKSTWGKRDYLLILFLCHTGLRIGEATRLTVHLATHQGQPRDELYLPAKITKTKRARVVPLDPIAQRCIVKLMEFNKARGFSAEPLAPLFPWKRHGFLPRREAERMIQELREKVGLSAKITPHTFRHFFATRLVSTGTDLATLQDILGHQSLRSTQIYTHTTEAKKREAVLRALQKESA